MYEKDIFILRAEVKKLIKFNYVIIEKLSNIEAINGVIEKKDLKEEVKVINALKANGTEPYPVTKSSVQKDTISQCNICDFEAASSITLRKHMNTKHPDARAETKHKKRVQTKG